MVHCAAMESLMETTQQLTHLIEFNCRHRNLKRPSDMTYSGMVGTLLDFYITRETDRKNDDYRAEASMLRERYPEQRFSQWKGMEISPLDCETEARAKFIFELGKMPTGEADDPFPLLLRELDERV
jgi:hypothetical protein